MTAMIPDRASTPAPERRPGAGGRALLETAALTLLVWLAYKALKLVEPPGWNILPGLVMAGAALLMARRRGPAVSLGLDWPWGRGRLALAVAVVVAALVGTALWVEHLGASPLGLGAPMISRVVVAVFAEELYFRGYVQSRLSRAGASGLWGSAILFGAVHLVNPTRPFGGHFEVDLVQGLGTLLMGLAYAGLRARSGHLWWSLALHGALNLWGLVMLARVVARTG